MHIECLPTYWFISRALIWFKSLPTFKDLILIKEIFLFFFFFVCEIFKNVATTFPRYRITFQIKNKNKLFYHVIQILEITIISFPVRQQPWYTIWLNNNVFLACTGPPSFPIKDKDYKQNKHKSSVKTRRSWHDMLSFVLCAVICFV